MPPRVVHQGDNGGSDGKSILQQQNHELAVDMRRRKRQEAELEKKLAQAWTKQGHFDATLSAVNRAWSQVQQIGVRQLKEGKERFALRCVSGRLPVFGAACVIEVVLIVWGCGEAALMQKCRGCFFLRTGFLGWGVRKLPMLFGIY